MTERLYFSDSCATTFTATVVGRATRAGHPAVALDRSAFYPEGGGQPADRGTLNDIAVLDVQSDDDGVVWHSLASPIPDTVVNGVVDWARRFDLMQQHHGQHLLSAAFEELFQVRTVAFHLGAAYATIDLAGDISDGQLRAAEDRTNRVIWEDRPVLARFVTAAELSSLPLRKPPTVTGAVRVVSVDGFDHSACGGTHPRTTGAVGVLHIRRRERRGAETRVEFVCGGRALRDLREQGALLQRLASGFSVGTHELEDVVTRLREREDGVRKRLATVMGALLTHEARRLAELAEVRGDTPLVQVVRDDLSLDEARGLAREITVAGAIAVVGVDAEKAQLIVARPQTHALDCGGLVRGVLAEFGGRGGGQAAMAQGGVPDRARLRDAVARAAALVDGL
jgi:alanyl-tRNA synthetase